MGSNTCEMEQGRSAAGNAVIHGEHTILLNLYVTQRKVMYIVLQG